MNPKNPFSKNRPVESPDETELAETIQLLNESRQAIKAPVEFKADLQKTLAAKGAAQQGSSRFFIRKQRRAGWITAGAVMLAIVLVLVLPILRHSAGTPQTTLPTTAGQTATPSATGSQAPLQKLLLSFFGSSVQAQADGNGLFGQTQFTLTAALPDGPAAAEVYEQHSEAVTSAEQAKALAAGLGINGTVYTTSSEGGGTMYYVTDGKQEVWFIDNANHFTYVADFGSGPASSANPQPLSVRVKAAEAFLKAHGLLNFDYRVDESMSLDNRVVFTCLLDGQPLLESDAYNPHIEVVLDGDGKVVSVFYDLNELNALGNYPLRSAKDAWNIVLNNPNDKRVQYSITTPEMSVRHVQPVWVRTYPIGQRVDLYDSVDVLPAAEAGGQPWVTMGEFNLEGDLNGLLDAQAHPQDLSAEQKARIASGEVSEDEAIGWASFFHVWGQTSQDANGVRTLQVEGWERSTQPIERLSGVFKSHDGQEVFAAQDGKQWQISEIPSDVPLDTTVNVNGVKVDGQPNTFDWSLIQVELPEAATAGGGGGGGGGPLVFSPDVNATLEPSATPQPMPYQMGEQVDGLVGILALERQIKSDGSKVLVAHLDALMPDNSGDSRYYQLLGDGLEGLSDLNSLHVRVWGTYTQTADGNPAIQMQRYEKAYPDEKLQAWLGHGSVVELGGRKVLKFTDVSGKQYILARSVTMPENSVEDPFNGQQSIIEGAIQPGSYEGLPLILDFRGKNAVGASNLDGYTIQSGEIPEEVEQSTVLPTPTVQNLTIDRAELVYFAYDFSNGGGGISVNDSPLRYVQPVWKFSGKLSDGRSVDVLVQAVTDDYLH